MLEEGLGDAGIGDGCGEWKGLACGCDPICMDGAGEMESEMFVVGWWLCCCGSFRCGCRTAVEGWAFARWLETEGPGGAGHAAMSGLESNCCAGGGGGWCCNTDASDLCGRGE